MARYLIEVPHPDEPVHRLRAVEIFLTTGSHFLTHADWGCMDGDHKAWMIVDVDTKDAARAIVPPALRAHARVVALTAFTMEDVERLRRHHGIL